MKKSILLLIIGIILLSPLITRAETTESQDLQLIRTTVYHCGTHTATGKAVREGYVAYMPEYFGKTCILYTQNMEYIGIFECEDTGGKLIRNGQRIDVYCDSLEECYEWVEQNGEYCYIQWIESEG